MAHAPTYLLDTNVLIHYARASIVGQAIEARFQFQGTAFKPMVCAVSVGEVLAIAQRNGWGAPKLKQLGELLDGLVRLPIDSQEVLDAYADIHTYCKRNGHALGDNDLWIAATAKVTGATLLTTDADFDPLAPGFIQMIRLSAVDGSLI